MHKLIAKIAGKCAGKQILIATHNDVTGKPVRHTCDPDKLANYFGKNPEAPHYLTPVFFRAEVLEKYYADPGKYSVEDGSLRCGRLWGRGCVRRLIQSVSIS
jgi:hypothetical protein